MSLFERMMEIDRRIIFVCVAVSVAVPLLHPLHLPIHTSPEARDYHKELERLEPGDIIIFSFDYEADTMAELDPMSYATLRYCFRKGVRIVALTMYAGGVTLGENILNSVAADYGAVYGEDYIFLGYNPDWSGTILRMGESFRATFPADQHGRPVVDFPIMQEADSYADTPLLVSVSASAISEYWAIWAGGRYGQRVISGNTAIQAILIYPYYNADQISGFLGGLKGAAELEILVGLPDAAVRGMDAQSTAHSLMVLFIVIGNIGYVLSGRAFSRRRQ